MLNAENVVRTIETHEHNYNAAIVRCVYAFGKNSRTEIDLNGRQYIVTLKTEEEKTVLYIQTWRKFDDGSAYWETSRMEPADNEDNSGDQTGLAIRTVSAVRQLTGDNDRIRREMPSTKTLERVRYFIEREREEIKLAQDLADSYTKDVDEFFNA